MALVFGHSQVKYLHEYIDSEDIVTLCYPGYKVKDFLDLDIVFQVVPSVSVSVFYNDIIISLSFSNNVKYWR